MARASGLTSREEIILHLHGLGGIRVDVEGPYAATREGISRALGIRPNHLSRELKVLAGSGEVVWETAHVLGFRKRVRVYGLTPAGRRSAERLIASLRSVRVRVVDGFGHVETLPLEKAYRRLGGKRGYLELLRGRASGGEDARPVSVMSPDMPERERLLGREEELDELAAWLRSDEAKILVLYGIAGIGKTSLVSMFAHGLRERAKIYLRMHEWDTVRGVLESLGEAFAWEGEERLQAHLRTHMNLDMTNILLILREMVGRLAPLIVIDDAWTAPDDLWKVLMMLCECVAGSSASKMMIVSREFPERLEGSPEAEGRVTRMRLDGLKERDARRLLASRGVGAPHRAWVDEIVNVTHGHPLLLRMVHGGEDVRSLGEGDVARFIHGEVYSRLSQREVALLNTLAVMRYPVPAALLTENVGYGVLGSLYRKSLIERVGGGIALHDIIRSFALVYMSREERRDAHLRAYEILRPPEAYRVERAYHALSSGSMEDTIMQLASESEQLIASGGAPELLNLLEDLRPGDVPSGARRAIVLIRMRCLAFTGEYGLVIRTYENAPEGLRSDAEAMLIAAESYMAIGESGEAHAIYGRMRASALDESLAVRLHRGLGKYHASLGEYEKARRRYMRGLSLARRSGWKEMEGQLLMDLGSLEIYRHRGRRATRYLLDAMRCVRHDERLLAHLYLNLSLGYYLQSMNTMAMDMIERAESVYRRCGDHMGMLKCLLNRGALLIEAGRAREAIDVLHGAVEISGRAAARPFTVGALTNLSFAYIQTGEYATSRELADRALRLAEALRDERGRVAAMNNLGFSLVCLGEWKEGVRTLEESLTLSERLGTHGLSTDAMEMLAEAYSKKGDVVQARTFARRGLALARSCGLTSAVRRYEVLLKRLDAPSGDAPFE